MRALFPIFVSAAVLFAQTISAQEVVTAPTEEIGELKPLDDLIGELVAIEPEEEEFGATGPTEDPVVSVEESAGGKLRVLDKLTGAVVDLDLQSGQQAQLGFLKVALLACRYPVENPNGDAFVYVDVSDTQEGIGLFQGWMIASAPALNAMDHPRYDVWALRCSTE